MGKTSKDYLISHPNDFFKGLAKLSFSKHKFGKYVQVIKDSKKTVNQSLATLQVPNSAASRGQARIINE